MSLAIFVRPLAVPKDQVIVKQGDAVDAFYLIKSGLC
jgi:CRP-like cAMP-binding protein